MDIMNVAPEDHNYDGLSDNSTDLERLDVVFKKLLGEPSGMWLEHNKLFVPYDKERIFDAKLVETGLVESGPYPQTYKISQPGLLVIERYGSYSKYFMANKPKQILDYLKPFGEHNFQDISKLLDTLFPLSKNPELHEYQEKGIEVRKLIYGMVDAGSIKLDNSDINKLGNGHYYDFTSQQLQLQRTYSQSQKLENV